MNKEQEEKLINEFRKGLKKTGWYPHLEKLGYRSKEEFLGAIEEFWFSKLEQQNKEMSEKIEDQEGTEFSASQVDKIKKLLK